MPMEESCMSVHVLSLSLFFSWQDLTESPRLGLNSSCNPAGLLKLVFLPQPLKWLRLQCAQPRALLEVSPRSKWNYSQNSELRLKEKVKFSAGGGWRLSLCAHWIVGFVAQLLSVALSRSEFWNTLQKKMKNSALATCILGGAPEMFQNVWTRLC